jgi:hypothetical protein
VVLQYTPNALNRSVLTGVGWIVGQLHSEWEGIRPIGQALPDWGAPRVVFWAIVEINEQVVLAGKRD